MVRWSDGEMRERANSLQPVLVAGCPPGAAALGGVVEGGALITN